MSKRLAMVLMIGAAALSACTKKAQPGDASAIPGGGGPYEETDTQSDPALAKLQADLVNAAGNDRVYFAFDAYTLTGEAQATLSRQAAWLRAHPAIGFSVEGHADERGTREYNLALGDRRARAAAEYLILQGIAPSRITTISYGKEKPDALESNERAYALNRRAVSVVIRLNR